MYYDKVSDPIGGLCVYLIKSGKTFVFVVEPIPTFKFSQALRKKILIWLRKI